MSQQNLNLMTVDARMLSLSNLVAEAGQVGERPIAEKLYCRWIEENPDHPQVYIALFNRACLLSEMGCIDTAIKSLDRALALNPDFLPARINLGSLHEKMGAANVALQQWGDVTQRLVAVTGASISYKVTALRQAARLLLEHQRLSAAEAVMRQSLELVPTQRDMIEQFMAVRLAQCCWPSAQGWEGMSKRDLLRGISPLSLLAYTDDPLMQLGLAHKSAQMFVDGRTASSRHDRRNASIPTDRRLRIGYVSSDIRDHAIGTLMAEVWELHNREDFEVFLYYCGPESNSEIQLRARQYIEHWVDIRPMSDEDAAARIASDNIDILIDINGYTRDARTGIFARRPAPVQINWLGYPGTMGTPYHHYIIADKWIIPKKSELYYSERVLRLPCYQPNDRKRSVAPSPTREAAGLPATGFVFCCFNASQKLRKHTFERWLHILGAVPGSLLWLLDGGEDMRRNLQDFTASRNIAPDRLIFAPKLANRDHLARYRLADLVLDSAPYGAHTTASDALWMGVPVLTLSGRSFASRVCGSLVRAAGTPEMVCTSPDAFVERAISLAQSPGVLQKTRQKLADRRSSCDLFAMEKLVTSLEGLFRDVSQRHRQELTPSPRLRNVESYFEIGLNLEHEESELFAMNNYIDYYRSFAKTYANYK